MKKLSLIIPLLKNSLSRFTLIFVLFQCSSLVSYAQTYGCHIYTLTGSQQRVYYTPDHSRDFPNNTGWIASAPSYNTFDAEKECIIDTGSGCTVYKSGTTGTSTADIMYSNGIEGTLYSYPCPIDDYIPLLFIFTAGLAFFQIKKRKVNLNNENIPHHRSL